MKRPSVEEAELSKTDGIISRAKEIAENEDLSAFYEIADRFVSDGGDIRTLSASLLYMSVKPQKAAKVKAARTDEKKDKKRKTAQKETGVARLFFNVGSLDKIRKRHLEELINDHPALCGTKILGTDIFDKFSFMDVSAKDAPDVCDALSGMTFKGRELTVEIAAAKVKPEVKKKKMRSKY